MISPLLFVIGILLGSMLAHTRRPVRPIPLHPNTLLRAREKLERCVSWNQRTGGTQSVTLDFIEAEAVLKAIQTKKDEPNAAVG